MPSRLIDANFVDAFKKQIKRTAKLQIASAWMSDSGALRALIERGKERCKVQAIIGTYGEATNAPSLRSLADKFGVQESLRLAETAGLFHPKLLLFHRRNGIVAWIGSANFTHGGLEGNEELVLETDDSNTVKEMGEWFGRQWTALKGQDSAKALEEYETKWAEAQKTRKDRNAFDILVHGKLPTVKPRPTLSEATIHMRPKARKANGKLTGVIEYGEGDTPPYDGAADGLRQLLLRLSEGRGDGFLNKCSQSQMRAFQKGGKPLLAKARTEQEARNKVSVRSDITVTRLELPERGVWGWWISEDTNSKGKWNMAKAAVEVANGYATGAGIALAQRSSESWPDEVRRS